MEVKEIIFHILIGGWLLFHLVQRCAGWALPITQPFLSMFLHTDRSPETFLKEMGAQYPTQLMR
jgi:hypothetical protein